MKPLAKIRRYIEQHAMLEGVRGVVVAVSGGPDSIALLDILLRLNAGTGPRPPAPGPHLRIAHLNHQLRGAESDEDAEFVRHLAESLNLPVTVESADVRAAAQAARRGIEEMAREIRYDFLLRVAQDTGCDRIATGHTMSDQAETFLMRLVRGSGSRGLAAMRPVCLAHEFAEWRPRAGGQGSATEEQSLPEKDLITGTASNKNTCTSSRPPAPGPRPLLIRPLLAITRGEVEAYCSERRLDYRIDPTNETDAYTRNRMRREVLPALQAINPQAVEAIARAAETLATEQEAIDALVNARLDAARCAQQRTTDADAISIAYQVAALCEQPAGLQGRMLLEAVRRMRAAGPATGNQEITARHIAAVRSLFDEQASGKRVQLPGGLEVWREFDLILFKQLAEAECETAAHIYRLELNAAHSRIEAGGVVLTIEREQSAEQWQSLIEQARQVKQNGGRDWLMAILDDAALPANLVVRPRQRGERVQVLSHQKTIKLKKLMIDHTIPASRRAAWPVVTTVDDHYVWSPGLPPAADFAARDETRPLAIVRALNC